MSRRSMVVVVALLVASGLLLHAAAAWARAGSGGSRGSRSYATPARPAPASPSSPSRSLSSAPPAPAGAQPGMLGGLGGFLLGGLLGSLLFGLGRGPGIGFLDLVLIGVALVLLARVVGRARAEPAPAYAGAYGGATTGPPDVPADAPTDLELGLAHNRQMDPAFDARAVVDLGAETFRAVQAAVTARDLTPIGAWLTARMREDLQAQCERLRRARQANRVDGIDIQGAEVSEAWQETGQDFVTVYLTGSLSDYTVDDASGRLVDGSTTPQPFAEFWTFTRPVGPNAWKLSAIQTG